MGLIGSLRSPTVDPHRRAGELLGVEAIDPSGLIVTSEGALVHIVHVTPRNPITQTSEDAERLAAGFRALVSRLRPDQTLQVYVQARPMNVDDLLAGCRDEVERCAGPPPSQSHPPRDRRARDRWRMYAAMEESIRTHALEQAAVDYNVYLVLPFLPATRITLRGSLEELFRGRERLPAGALARDSNVHRRVARQAVAHVDAVRTELHALGMPSRQLGGAEVARLLHSRFNPTVADRGACPRFDDILDDLSEPRDVGEARDRAVKLHERIASSPLDFSTHSAHAVIDRDLEQVLYASSTADATYFGWLLGAMMTCPEPFVMSVFVRALDRRRERGRLKRSYRRTFAVNRYAESKGQVPDFDRYHAEHEHERLLGEMSGHEHAGVFRLSIYQAIRERGPNPHQERLHDAVAEAAERLASASDCRIDHGRHQQAELWPATLPLGRDVADRSRRYATPNVGDTLPLLGFAVGSPTGIPFAYTEPGRTLERFNPYDRVHPNHLCLVTGRSGAGKTLLCNMLLARAISQGARGFVIDRAGHYRVLTRLIDGAQHVDIGADDAEFHLNPWDSPDPASVSREKVAFLIGLHETMIEEGLTTLERAQLGTAIRAVYEHAAATGETPRESLLKRELEERADREQASGSADTASTLRNLAERLSEYCGDGTYAHVADQPSTHVTDAPLLVFDTRRCPEAILRSVIFTVLEFITRTVERHRSEAHELRADPDEAPFAGRSIMLGDEFWSVMANPALGAYANDLARRSRHLGLTMLISTQQLSDFDNEYGLGLLRNSTIQVFLAQHREELGFVQRAIGLSDAEVELIAGLKTVKGAYSQAFWVNGTRGRGQVSVRVGATELWAFTSDPVRDAPVRDAAIAQHGDVWKAIVELARSGGRDDVAPVGPSAMRPNGDAPTGVIGGRDG
jgi:TraG P-loop domain